MRHFKLSLFNKLLGFLLLCLVCSGAVAVVLIRGQMTHLAYDQMRVLFESDFRNVRAFLQAKADGLLAVARDLAKDELLKTGLELEVFDQVKNLTENRKTTLGLSEVMVINAQKRLVSRGDARRDTTQPPRAPSATLRAHRTRVCSHALTLVILSSHNVHLTGRGGSLPEHSRRAWRCFDHQGLTPGHLPG